MPKAGLNGILSNICARFNISNFIELLCWKSPPSPSCETLATNNKKTTMKHFFLIIILVVTISCNNKRPEPNFYKNLYTGEILNKYEFEKFRNSLYLKNIDSTKKISLNFVFSNFKNTFNDITEKANKHSYLILLISFCFFNLFQSAIHIKLVWFQTLQL